MKHEDTAWGSAVAVFRLLSLGERKKAIIIFGFSFLAGLSDMIALVSVYPLIGLLVQPDLVETNFYINYLWVIVGEPMIGPFVVMLAVSVGGLIAVGSGLNFVATVQANRFSASCQERLGGDLMRALLQASYIWHLQKNPLLLGNLFQNHLAYWGQLIRKFFSMGSQIATIILPAAALISWSPIKGTLILIIAAALVTLLLSSLKQRINFLYRQAAQAQKHLHILQIETLQGLKDITLSSREYYFAGAFKRAYHIFSSYRFAANTWDALAPKFVMTVGQILILACGVGLFLFEIKGGPLASTMAIIILVASRVLPAMNLLGASFNELGRIAPYIKELNETLSSAERASSRGVLSAKTPQRLSWQKLIFRDVCFTFPNSKIEAIKNVNLTLVKGNSYAFVGASGAGKSTLIDLGLGLLYPTSGTLEVDGVAIDETIRQSWQAAIGYVPQSPLIADLSLRENIAFGVPKSDIDDAKVLRCLELVQLKGNLEDFSWGLDILLGDRGGRMSGGQRQRVAIARTLYSDPEILVLDEATSALDMLSENAIREMLVNLRGTVTVISIAHRFSNIKHYDCIFLMAGGEIIASGTFDELMNTNELFRKLAAM